MPFCSILLKSSHVCIIWSLVLIYIVIHLLIAKGGSSGQRFKDVCHFGTQSH